MEQFSISRHPKSTDGMANSVGPDQTASLAVLVCTICSALSVPFSCAVEPDYNATLYNEHYCKRT